MAEKEVERVYIPRLVLKTPLSRSAHFRHVLGRSQALIDRLGHSYPAEKDRWSNASNPVEILG